VLAVQYGYLAMLRIGTGIIGDKYLIPMDNSQIRAKL